ncbi:hypothetical protein CR970_01750 [Candidatus Saccharibacteria bacterium]|nr:MAG: hypothetical protein CR970_01750 [Candidatus Saccharibacteria bacterium]
MACQRTSAKQDTVASGGYWRRAVGGGLLLVLGYVVMLYAFDTAKLLGYALFIALFYAGLKLIISAIRQGTRASRTAGARKTPQEHRAN